MDPDLTVVVPSYNCQDILARTLDALGQQDVETGRYRVVVVDDGSTDAGPEIAQRFAGSRPEIFRQIRHDENRGLSAARNSGWRAARSPIVLFLDADLIACPELVRAHLDAHARHPEENRGVLGNVAYPPDDDRTPLRNFGNQVVQMWEGMEDKPGRLLDWRCFLGGHISLKRSLLEKCGGFNEEYFVGSEGFEDSELGLMLWQKHDFRIVYAPEAASYHYHWREPAAVLDNMRNYGRTLARWLGARQELRDEVLKGTRDLACFQDRPPLRLRLREACRLALVNRVTAPAMLAAANWLAPRWERAAAFLYWRLEGHYLRMGFREGRKAGP